ncbi:MAG: bifunctional folylpolyglutamate synthase/dihydrofolate synthase [Candidatus Eisenbacteria sp.]|nr:bifunctional folylpolyglutamate synthase/dihydrofolate synthase [Candidatus Eisenbacteria bacterium]
MEYSAAIQFLYALEHGAIKLGLERIVAATAAREHPERCYATIHVAGTNGKGSTCALLTAILAAAGLRTGLLTSPHLLDFRERIRIDGHLSSAAEIAAVTSELTPLIREIGLSYFEATTLLAFELFARHQVDVAVIEVGMGGRLDATNVVHPALTIVTGIDLDHVKSLGRTRPQIAGEKAGIIKGGVPLLLGPSGPAVREVFRRRAQELAAPLELLERRVRWHGVVPQGRGTRYDWQRPAASEAAGARTGRQTIRLCGAHQVVNALLADEAAHLLAAAGWPLDGAARRAGLTQGAWPGRFQLRRPRSHGPLTVFDVAHNVQGATAIVETWRRWLPDAKDATLIVGMLGDKRHAAFLRRLRPLGERLLLIPLDSPRAGPLEPIARAARRGGFEAWTCAGVAEAWRRAMRWGAPVLITGSFLTVEAGMRLLGMRPVERLFAFEPSAAEPMEVGRPRAAGGGRCQPQRPL